jgi:tetraprenyl-beta-curcumene synthase
VVHPKPGLPHADHWLTARTGVALARANGRYWSSVAPIVRAQLRRWEQQARAIPDPSLRALARQKLHDERFNAEVAATLATLAPRAHRAPAVQAVVAFEVMYDYLDGLTEQATPDPLRNGRQLFQAFTDALDPLATLSDDYYQYHPQSEDGGYLRELANAVRAPLRQLPAASAIAAAARAGAARCADAQIRVHTTPYSNDPQREHWATRAAAGTPLEWREFIAGAVASVLAVHALIAAAADPQTTPEQAAAIDTTYLSISALSTMLDSLIDHERDLSTGRPWYLQHYEDHRVIARQLAHVAGHAVREARTLPNAAHHVMTLVGVVAYYTSAPAAGDEFARPLVTHIKRELRPLIVPTLAIMRTWRIAKRLRCSHVLSRYTDLSNNSK